MITETCTPMWEAAAITGPASASTSPAGSRVTSGASSARKAKSSRTMMKRTESSWVAFWEWAEAVSLSVAIASSRSGGTAGRSVPPPR